MNKKMDWRFFVQEW